MADFIISGHDIYARRQVFNILKLFYSCRRSFLHDYYRSLYADYGVAPAISIVPQAIGTVSVLIFCKLPQKLKNENNKVWWLFNCHP